MAPPDLQPAYRALDALIDRALDALAASRCPCCQPWARAEGLRLSVAAVQQTRTLDRRLRAQGLLPDCPSPAPAPATSSWPR